MCSLVFFPVDPCHSHHERTRCILFLQSQWADPNDGGILEPAGGIQGGDVSTNPFPSGQVTSSLGNAPLPDPVPEIGSAGNVPSPNSSASRNQWDTEDDEGFPVSFVILLLVFFVGVLYRKSQNREATPTGDVANRGGYAPVASRYHTD